MRKNITAFSVAGIFWLLTFFFIFNFFQNEANFRLIRNLGAYAYTAPPESSNTAKKFQKIFNGNLIHWDSWHYQFLKDHGYSGAWENKNDYTFAFFPMFPWVWKLSGFGLNQIIFLNFFFALAGIYLLSKSWVKGSWSQLFFAAGAYLAFPGNIIFFMPYSEGLFFLLISLWIYFERKQRIYLSSGFLLLASMTRPVFAIFIAAVICVGFIRFIRERSLQSLVRPGLRLILVVLTGTALVYFLQFAATGFTDFIYFGIQRDYYQTFFRLPGALNDWSFEGFALNIFVIASLIIPAVMLLIGRLMKVPKPVISKEDHAMVGEVAMAYILITFLIVLFFQGGSLHSLHRYTMATPFGLIVMGLFLRKLNLARLWQKASVFILITAGVFAGLYLTTFNAVFVYSDLGMVTALLILGFMIFKDHLPIILQYKGLTSKGTSL